MGGRGRGGGTGSTVRAVANALGIARHEMATYSQHKPFEAPALYPIVQRALIPLELSNELQYIAELKLEMVNRFNESPYYLDHKETLDIRRYTDKYNQVHREKLHPDFSRIPDELCWRADIKDHKPKKRKIEDSASDVLKDKLSQLEEAEVEGEEDEDEEEENSDKSEHAEEEEFSEGFVEEDNDYISTYFDNGEGYGDGGSDDNMDGEEY